MSPSPQSHAGYGRSRRRLGAALSAALALAILPLQGLTASAATTPPSPWRAGFESGGFSEWSAKVDVGNRVTVVNGGAHTGNGSARFVYDDATPEYLTTTIPAASSLKVAAWVKYNLATATWTGTGSTKAVVLRSAAGQVVGELYVRVRSAKVQAFWRAYATSGNSDSGWVDVVSNSNWHLFEMSVAVGASAGSTSFLVDGIKVHTATGLANLSRGSVTRVDVGDVENVTTGTRLTWYLDDAIAGSPAAVDTVIHPAPPPPTTTTTTTAPPPTTTTTAPPPTTTTTAPPPTTTTTAPPPTTTTTAPPPPTTTTTAPAPTTTTTTAPPAPAPAFDVFVDATNGSDGADGRSPQAAWQTLARVALNQLAPGTRVGLKRGETWREELRVPSSGTAVATTIFGAYGDGAAPRILGSDARSTAASWTSATSGQWFTTMAGEPKVVWRNAARMTRRASLAEVGVATDWFWSASDRRLYVGGGTNPINAGTTFEVAQRLNGISAANKEYIRVTDLDLRYFNHRGIDVGWTGTGSARGVELADLDITGSWHDGIHLGNNEASVRKADGADIHGNHLSDLGGDAADDINGIRLNSADDFSIADNVISVPNVAHNGYVYGVVLRYTSPDLGVGETREVVRNQIHSSAREGAGALAATRVNRVTFAQNEVTGSIIGMRFDEHSKNTFDGPAYNIVRDNRFILSGAVGFAVFIEVSDNNSFYRNVIDCSRCTGTQKTTWLRASNGNDFSHNTVIAPAGAIGLQLGWASDTAEARNNKVRNNIFYRTGTNVAVIWADNPSGTAAGNELNGNLYNVEQSLLVNWYRRWFSTVGSLAAGTGQEATRSIGDPRFMSAAGGDYRLQAGSPAIDKAVVMATNPQVIYGAGPDVGAFERTG